MITKELLIALHSLPGWGLRSVQKAISAVGVVRLSTPEDLLKWLGDTSSGEGWPSLPSADQLRSAAIEAERTIADSSREGITVIGYGEETCHPRLWAIPDPPLVLYAKGNLGCLRADAALALVGTRKPSPQGQKAASRLGRRFAEEGFVIVSGLALGCDTAAHEGCLEAHGLTVAVLAHGLDTLYPASNKELAAQILKAGGCLVSEYPLRTRSQRHTFVHRDRIQSGLSVGVVVVETDPAGGSMHTARYCKAQGRLLGCWWRGNTHQQDPQMQGNRELIEKAEAFGIESADNLQTFLSRARERSAQRTGSVDQLAPASNLDPPREPGKGAKQPPTGRKGKETKGNGRRRKKAASGGEQRNLFED
jgi:DNA processing protein